MIQFFRKKTHNSAKKLLLFLSIFILPSFSLHPVHIALTNVEYSEQQQAFNIVFKIFSDDFQTALEQHSQQNVDIIEIPDTLVYSRIISNYLSENFSITINNKALNFNEFQFQKIKSDFEATWIFYTAKFIDNVKSVSIKNSILHQIYPDQKNILFFTYHKTRTQHILKYHENIVHFEINE